MESDNTKDLVTILRAVRSADELHTLLTGLLTPQEIEEILLRWRLLLELTEGHAQREIARDLGVSLGKIARGSRLLKYEVPEFVNLIEQMRREGRIGDDDDGEQ